MWMSALIRVCACLCVCTCVQITNSENEIEGNGINRQFVVTEKEGSLLCTMRCGRSHDSRC